MCDKSEWEVEVSVAAGIMDDEDAAGQCQVLEGQLRALCGLRCFLDGRTIYWILLY